MAQRNPVVEAESLSSTGRANEPIHTGSTYGKTTASSGMHTAGTTVCSFSFQMSTYSSETLEMCSLHAQHLAIVWAVARFLESSNVRI